MRIAVVNLAARGFSGGYIKYLHALMPMLRADPRVAQLDVYVPDVTKPQIRLDDVRTWAGKFALAELRSQVAARGTDVVFIPAAHYVDFGSAPVVAMVRNMEPLLVPFAGNTVMEGMRNVLRAASAKRACRRADHIIAVSKFVRDHISDRWELPARKVSVVYHGVDEPVTPRRPDALPATIGDFLFTGGSIRPARGLEELLQAMVHLGQSGLRPMVVVAGAADRGNAPHALRLRRLADQLGVSSQVHWLGHLDPGAMRWCMERCGAFVMTSHVEACPNIVLEAMAAGAPTVSTDQPPMPEFLGDAAIYYEAENSRALAQSLARFVQQDSAAVQKQRQLARERAAEFTWRHTANRTIEELQRVMASR